MNFNFWCQSMGAVTNNGSGYGYGSGSPELDRWTVVMDRQDWIGTKGIRVERNGYSGERQDRHRAEKQFSAKTLPGTAGKEVIMSQKKWHVNVVHGEITKRIISWEIYEESYRLFEIERPSSDPDIPGFDFKSLIKRYSHIVNLVAASPELLFWIKRMRRMIENPEAFHKSAYEEMHEDVNKLLEKIGE